MKTAEGIAVVSLAVAILAFGVLMRDGFSWAPFVAGVIVGLVVAVASLIISRLQKDDDRLAGMKWSAQHWFRQQ